MTEWWTRREDDFWNGLLNTVWYMVLASLFGGGVLATILTWIHSALNEPFHGKFLVISFMLSSLGLMVILLLAARRRKLPQEVRSQSAIVAANAPPVETIDKFYNRLDPGFSKEVETAIRNTAIQIPDQNREAYLYRALTIAFIVNNFEILWFNIFASQIKMLQKLNIQHMKREEIFPFYAEPAQENPANYANYSFDQWLGFLRANTVIRDDAEFIRITVKGRDFLKFIIDEAKPVHLKKL